MSVRLELRQELMKKTFLFFNENSDLYSKMNYTERWKDDVEEDLKFLWVENVWITTHANILVKRQRPGGSSWISFAFWYIELRQKTVFVSASSLNLKRGSKVLLIIEKNINVFRLFLISRFKFTKLKLICIYTFFLRLGLKCCCEYYGCLLLFCIDGVTIFN